MSDVRAFVLLGWDPDTGAAVAPVGALAVDADGAWAVQWDPHRHGDSIPWRAAISAAGEDLPHRLGDWLAEHGTRQLVETDPPGFDDVLTAAAAALDATLTPGSR